jgi:hypothetical protein
LRLLDGCPVHVAGDRPSVGELAAVGVLTTFRRRGIATAILLIIGS